MWSLSETSTFLHSFVKSRNIIFSLSQWIIICSPLEDYEFSGSLKSGFPAAPTTEIQSNCQFFICTSKGCHTVWTSGYTFCSGECRTIWKESVGNGKVPVASPAGDQEQSVPHKAQQTPWDHIKAKEALGPYGNPGQVRGDTEEEVWVVMPSICIFQSCKSQG